MKILVMLQSHDQIWNKTLQFWLTFKVNITIKVSLILNICTDKAFYKLECFSLNEFPHNLIITMDYRTTGFEYILIMKILSMIFYDKN